MTATGAPLELELEKAEDVLGQIHPNRRLGGVSLEGTPPSALGSAVIRVQSPVARHFSLRARRLGPARGPSADRDVRRGLPARGRPRT